MYYLGPSIEDSIIFTDLISNCTNNDSNIENIQYNIVNLCKHEKNVITKLIKKNLLIGSICGIVIGFFGCKLWHKV